MRIYIIFLSSDRRANARQFALQKMYYVGQIASHLPMRLGVNRAVLCNFFIAQLRLFIIIDNVLKNT
jgi:hypothetical protein